MYARMIDECTYAFIHTCMLPVPLLHLLLPPWELLLLPVLLPATGGFFVFASGAVERTSFDAAGGAGRVSCSSAAFCLAAKSELKSGGMAQCRRRAWPDRREASWLARLARDPAYNCSRASARLGPTLGD